MEKNQGSKRNGAKTPLHTLDHRQRQTHYVTLLPNDPHRQTYQHTNNILAQLAPERVRTITTATYEVVSTDQEITLSVLEDVLHRLKDTAPGDDTVCYSIIKNVPLATKHLFLRLINQSFSEGRLPTRWKIAKIVPIPKKDKTHRPISLLPALSKTMERLVLARVKWSAQTINPY